MKHQHSSHASMLTLIPEQKEDNAFTVNELKVNKSGFSLNDFQINMIELIPTWPQFVKKTGSANVKAMLMMVLLSAQSVAAEQMFCFKDKDNNATGVMHVVNEKGRLADFADAMKKVMPQFGVTLIAQCPANIKQDTFFIHNFTDHILTLVDDKVYIERMETFAHYKLQQGFLLEHVSPITNAGNRITHGYEMAQRQALLSQANQSSTGVGLGLFFGLTIVGVCAVGTYFANKKGLLPASVSNFFGNTCGSLCRGSNRNDYANIGNDDDNDFGNTARI